MQQVKHIPGRGRVYIPASYFWGRTSENTPSRNCLIIPERPHCGLPREVRTEPEVSFRRLWWRQSQAFTGPLTIYQTVSPRTPVNKGPVPGQGCFAFSKIQHEGAALLQVLATIVVPVQGHRNETHRVGQFGEPDPVDQGEAHWQCALGAQFVRSVEELVEL